MPTCFQFVRNSDRHTVTLNEIDRICCEKFGEAYSTTKYSMTFQVLTWVAMDMAMKATNNQITEESFEAFKAANPDAVEDWDFMKQLVLIDYSYSAWYQVR